MKSFSSLRAEHPFHHIRRFAATSLAIAGAALVGACGGGGSGPAGSVNGSVESITEVQAVGGDSVLVTGRMQTSSHLLRAMSWTIGERVPASSPNILLSNNGCAAITRVDKPLVVNGGTDPTRTGSSDWSCDLNVITPPSLEVETLYKLILTGADDQGNLQTRTTMVRVAKPPAPIPGVGGGAAGLNFSAQSGTPVPLRCATKANSSYQWVIVENSGLLIRLASDVGQNTEFAAPIVTTPTPVVAECRVTDNTGRVTPSRVQIMITPPPAPTLVLGSLVGPRVGKPGVLMPFSITSNWADSTGALVTGPAVAYRWTVDSAAPFGTRFDDPTSRAPSLMVPTGVTSVTNIVVSVAVVSGVNLATTSLIVTIDPVSGTTPTINPAAQSVVAGAPVTASAPVAADFHYQWSVVGGPSVLLGGANTSTVGFIAPSVLTRTNIILRLSVGYAPITASYPGVYHIDTVIDVRP